MSKRELNKFWTARRIRELREDWLGLNREEFAASILASIYAVKHWERGGRPNGPTLCLFEKLAAEAGMKSAI